MHSYLTPGAPHLETEHGTIVYGVHNEPLQLTCTAPNSSVVWYRDQVPLISGGRVTVEGGTLSYSMLDVADSGWLTCAASNTFGRDEIDFLLFVEGEL